MTAAPVAEPLTAADFRIFSKQYLFLPLFEKAANVIPSKEVMQVLRNFQVEASPGRLRIAATDMELSVIVTTSMVTVETPGTIFIPARKFMEMLRTAPHEDMSVEVLAGVATIRCGKTTWTQKLEDGREFPALPEITEVRLHDVDRIKFLAGLRAVRYAASTDTTRANLAMIDVTNGVMTASDGARFQQAQLGDEFPLSLQIPISAVDDIVRLLNDDSTSLATISIGESENHIVFKVGENVFIANKLMVTFPNIEAQLLAPTRDNIEELYIDREALLEVIKRVRISSDPETSAIVLRVSEDSVLVCSRDKFGNASEEPMNAGWKFSDRTVVVNHKFLEQMLNMYDGKTCRFLLGPPKGRKEAPLLLKDEQTGAIGVIQQMRLDWILETR